MNLTDLIESSGVNSFSCCHDRSKLKIKDKHLANSYLKEILKKNEEYLENENAKLDDIRNLQKRILIKQSEAEIFGGSVRQIAGGYGKNTVIVKPIENREESINIEQSGEQFKREFNFLKQKPWYNDLALADFIDSNEYKQNIKDFTKGYYPKFKIAEGGENIDQLSKDAVKLWDLGEDKFTALIEKLLSEDFGKPKKVVKKPNLPKPLKVKYTKPSGKVFVYEPIDESAIWGNNVANNKFVIPNSFEDDKVNISFSSFKDFAEKSLENKEFKIDNTKQNDIASLNNNEDSSSKKDTFKAHNVNSKKANKKVKLVNSIDENAIWGNSFKNAFNMPSSFSDDKVLVKLKDTNNGVADGEVKKIAPIKPKRIKKENKATEQKKKNEINTLDIVSLNDEQPQIETSKIGDSKSNLADKKQGVKKQTHKKANKNVKPKKIIIHLSKEEAKRRYTLPKGKVGNFDIDEDLIWQGQKKDVGTNIKSILSNSFKDDSFNKDK